jgi:hypothetical protein
MPITLPPLDFDHKPGFKIPTKHKEAICQLYGFAGKSVKELMDRYRLSKSTIVYILSYEHPERARPTRTGRLQELPNTKVNTIIKYLLES